MTLSHIVLPVTDVHATIREEEGATSMSETVEPCAFIASSIWIEFDSLSVLFVVKISSKVG